jgi:Polymerase beta, Nucleotidyltransferase
MPGTLSNLPIASLPEAGAHLSLLRERYPHVGELEQFVECVSRLQPLAVILFGSLTTGEFTQHSDADVAVIFATPVDWMNVYRCSSGRIQPLVYDAEQFVQMINNANGLALEICYDGWILAGQPAYLSQLKKTFSEVQHRYGLEKTKTGWVLQNRG